MKFTRHVIAYLLCVGYLGIGGYFAYFEKVDADLFLTTLGQWAGIIVAFLFGERAALKKPGGSNE